MTPLQNGTFNFLPQGITKLFQGQMQYMTEMEPDSPPSSPARGPPCWAGVSWIYFYSSDIENS